MSSNAIDLESSANPQQIIDSSQSARKISRSTKPIPLKMDVISRTTLGHSKTKIAADLGITRNTVCAILKESNFEADYAGGRFGVKSLIFDSVEGLEHHVSKKSLKACTYVLDNTIFKEESGSRTFSANVQVNVAIPRAKVLVNNMPEEQKAVPQIASNSEVLEVQPTSTTTNSGSAVKSKS